MAKLPPMDLRKAIFAADDLQTQDVEVSEWKVIIRVRGLNAYEVIQYQKMMAEDAKVNGELTLLKQAAILVCLGCIKPDGSRLFENGDVDMLCTKSASALVKLMVPIRDLSGLNPDARSFVRQNFTKAPTAASSSV